MVSVAAAKLGSLLLRCFSQGSGTLQQGALAETGDAAHREGQHQEAETGGLHAVPLRKPARRPSFFETVRRGEVAAVRPEKEDRVG